MDLRASCSYRAMTSARMVSLTLAAGLVIAGCAAPKQGGSKGSAAAETAGGASPARLVSAGGKADEASIAFARDRVFPALVNITVISVSHWGGKERKGGATGSGTIVSADGLVVTNHHVVDDGRTFRVTLADKRECAATLVGDDPMTDLAVLRLNLKELAAADGKQPTLPVAVFGDSDRLRVGDPVLAMGAPYGLNRSVTLGVVSNTERVFTGMSGDDIMDQEFDFDRSSDIFTRWLQHDALILPGNSGGPLVNLEGEIIGINTRGGSGLGFANPASFAKRIVDELIAKGEVTRSTIGANFKSVKRAGYQEGVLINSVNKDGPAARAGLLAGDVVTAIDGAPSNARFPEEIPLVLRAIAEKPVGAPVVIAYRRGDQTGTVTVSTEKLLREKGKETSLRLFGFSISEITDKMARNRNLTTTEGALLLGVRGGGPAETAEPAMAWGDVVKSVDGVPIRTFEDLVDRYKSIAQQDPLPEFVTIEFDRNGKNQLTLIKPRPEKPDDPPRELPKAWIGVASQPVLKDLAKQLGIPDQSGFRVTRVYPGTIAAASGLMVGDIVTKLNGDSLSPRGMQDAGMFQRKVRQLSIDAKARLTVLRDRKPVELEVGLERTRLTPDEAIRDANKDFEIVVRELTFFDRDDNRWDESVKGVMTQSVERAGWAGFAGMLEGDLIQRINSYVITDLGSYRDAMKAIGRDQPERVTFVVLRGARTQHKFAEPDWKPITTAEPGPAGLGK